MNEVQETGCCPRFDAGPWDEAEHVWEDRLFVKDRVRAVLHIPLNFGAVMKRNIERIEAAGALDPAQLVLCDENSLWGADVYIAVTQEVPAADRHARLSGTFFSKVFEGPYSQARRFCDETRAAVEAQGREVQKMYSWYTTCPRCAKAYGSNPIVMLAQV